MNEDMTNRGLLLRSTTRTEQHCLIRSLHTHLSPHPKQKLH
jgi:hypothetical protein